MRGQVPIPEWHILRGTGDDFGPSRHEQWGSAGGEQAATARPAIRKLVWCGTCPSAMTALLLMLVTDVVQKVPVVRAPAFSSAGGVRIFWEATAQGVTPVDFCFLICE